MRIYNERKAKLIQCSSTIFTNFIPNFHVIYAMQEKKQFTVLLSLLAMFTLIVLNMEVAAVNAYAAAVNDGTIVYEQPTNIEQLSKIPLQILIGLGVALAAIAILVLYKARK